SLELVQTAARPQNRHATLYPPPVSARRRKEPPMTVQLALYQPDIAQNTGTLLRLGACLEVTIHVIHPTGFPFSRRELKRGALDYLDHVEIVEHDSYAHFAAWTRASHRRIVLLTT